MAFVSSLTPSSFAGTRVPSKSAAPNAAAAAAAPPRVAVSMKYSALDQMLDKYAKLSAPAPAVAPLDPNAPSETSKVWKAFQESAITNRASEQERSLEQMMRALARGARPFANSDSPPATLAGDAYMASCVTRQYKAVAGAPSGVYSVRCVEGSQPGHAESARVAALANDFRARQRAPLAQFADMYETRRRAAVAAHGCSYEEALTARFKATASAVVRGADEVVAACARYSTSADAAEGYMAKCVDKQSKMRAVVGGVYDLMCLDGTTGGMAEDKRVLAEAAKFRIGQLPDLAKAQWKYDVAKNARTYYGHGCTYEEKLFNKYPAVASSMRPSNVRYN